MTDGAVLDSHVMTTERLYYTDSHLTEFDARVVAVRTDAEWRSSVTLDRTAFYPTGGGQPADTGTLGPARVVDCVETEDGGVTHVVEGDALQPDVEGSSDAPPARTDGDDAASHRQPAEEDSSSHRVPRGRS